MHESDIVIDADCAIVENEMAKTLLENIMCPICIGVSRLNQSAIMCSTCGSHVCEFPCFYSMPNPKQCP